MTEYPHETLSRVMMKRTPAASIVVLVNCAFIYWISLMEQASPLPEIIFPILRWVSIAILVLTIIMWFLAGEREY